jgi:hypothetical protein
MRTGLAKQRFDCTKGVPASSCAQFNFTNSASQGQCAVPHGRTDLVPDQVPAAAIVSTRRFVELNAHGKLARRTASSFRATLATNMAPCRLCVSPFWYQGVLLFFRDTVSGFPPGTITHVAITGGDGSMISANSPAPGKVVQAFPARKRCRRRITSSRRHPWLPTTELH